MYKHAKGQRTYSGMGKPDASRLEAHRSVIRARYASTVAHDLQGFPERWPSAPKWLKAEVKRMRAVVWVKRYGAKTKRPKPKATLLESRLAEWQSKRDSAGSS